MGGGGRGNKWFGSVRRGGAEGEIADLPYRCCLPIFILVSINAQYQIKLNVNHSR